MQSLEERLREVMKAKGWDHAGLMRASGESSSVVSQWLGKGSKPIQSIRKVEAAERIEKESGFAALWIARGIGPKFAATSAAPVAHPMSHLPFNLRLTTREQLMTGERPKGRFLFRLIDNALGSFARQGEQVVFDSELPPEPGDGILLVDGSGEVHVRRMAKGKNPMHWQAVADDPVIYPTLDSQADSLEVIAVWVTVLDQRLSRR